MIRAGIIGLVAALLACGAKPPQSRAIFRLMTAHDFCLSLPVYAQPNEHHFVGYLQGEAMVPDGGRLVPSLNLKVRVDGDDWSVWRRQSEVLKWYVRSNQPLLQECTWISHHDRWDPTNLELSLDDRIWLQRWGGWARHRGLFSARFSI